MKTVNRISNNRLILPKIVFIVQIANKRVVIVNRNYPPRTGVTGESACRFATYLQSNFDVDVIVVSALSKYAGGGSGLASVGDVRLIPSWYDGKNKLLRFFSSFFVSLFLIRTARSIKSDHVIVMTDPPFLQFWASLLLSGKRPWTLWSMDLFPNAFVAGNFVSANNFAYRALKYLTYRNTPNALIALGPLQVEYLVTQYGREIPNTFIIPCGVCKRETNPSTDINSSPIADIGPGPDWKSEYSNRIIIGYCGNLGEAHSVEFLKQIINHLDETRFHLILAVYGVHAQEILDHAKNKNSGLTIVSRVDRTEMHHIDIHLVSLLKNWAHVCVPSKAVSAICSGSPILFYGTRQCDNWALLGEAGWLIEEDNNSENLSSIVRDFLAKVTDAEIREKKLIATTTSDHLQSLVEIGYAKVATYLLDRKQISEPFVKRDAQPNMVTDKIMK